MRRPTEEFAQLRKRLRTYADFLQRSFADANIRVFLPPFLRRHLPYAMAAGIDGVELMIRSGEAKWFRGTSGAFSCKDFSRAVQRALKRA